MNDPFSEAHLREDGLTDSSPLLQAVIGPSLLDSVNYVKLEGPRWVTGWPRLSRGALG